jgi:hypothetical protein
VSDSFYVRDGEGFVATVNTQGAWHPNQQHGGAVQGLLSHCIEQVPTLTPMQLTRLTVDMVKPVPIGERLDVRSTITREGKKIQTLSLTMVAGDTELVRATALRVRVEDVVGRTNLPNTTVLRELELPPPESVTPAVYPADYELPGFLRAVEMRRFQAPEAPEGVFGWWLRATLPLIDDDPMPPLSRLMIAADMANTIGVLLDPTSYTTINPDMSVHVLRPPAGEFIAVVGHTRFNLGAGLGVSAAQLTDRDGICALVSTSQLVQLR